jgi:ribonucleoside-diphosphate reductase alpha chain
MAKVWNKPHVQAHQAPADDASVKLAMSAARAPMPPITASWSASPTRWRSRRPRRSRSSAAAPRPASSRTPPTPTRTRPLGLLPVRNPYLAKLLEEKGKNTDDVWTSIFTNEGSVLHLDFLTTRRKRRLQNRVRDRPALADRACGDRTPFVCQAQSLNVFLPANVHKAELHRVHFEAWKKGVKSLYYCRSKSIQRAESDASWKRSQGEAPCRLITFCNWSMMIAGPRIRGPFKVLKKKSNFTGLFLMARMTMEAAMVPIMRRKSRSIF